MHHRPSPSPTGQRPVRLYQQRKMRRYFPIKPGKPRRIAFTMFFPFPNNLNERNLPNWFCQNGTANFGRTGLRGQAGGPSQEWSLIFGQMELKRTFPFDTDRDFPKFWHNRKTPATRNMASELPLVLDVLSDDLEIVFFFWRRR